MNYYSASSSSRLKRVHRIMGLGFGFEESNIIIPLGNTENGSCNSSTSSSPDLSDLVNSYIEQKDDEEEKEGVDDDDFSLSDDDEDDSKKWSISEMKETLQSLFQGCDQDSIKEMIRAETELIIKTNSSSSSLLLLSTQKFKSLLVSRLRDVRGFDAGLCQTCWDNMDNNKSGFSNIDFKYIDILVDGTRYIIEVSLAEEFSIARATDQYLSLLAEFPHVFVGKPEDLKQVVKIMCMAVKDSMKRNDMHLPPWRRIWYMEAKWFGSHTRITTDVLMAEKALDSGGEKAEKTGESAASLPPEIYHYYCRGEVEAKLGSRIGKLTLALNGNGS